VQTRNRTAARLLDGACRIHGVGRDARALGQGAARETLEEACAEVELGELFACVDVIDAGQVHFFFKARLNGGYGAGAESLETQLFDHADIPWDDIAFHSVKFAMQKFLEDAGEYKGVHFHEVRRSRLVSKD